MKSLSVLRLELLHAIPIKNRDAILKNAIKTKLTTIVCFYHPFPQSNDDNWLYHQLDLVSV